MKENSLKQTSSGFTHSSVTGNDAGNYSKQVAVHFNTHSHYTDIHRMATVFVKLHSQPFQVYPHLNKKIETKTLLTNLFTKARLRERLMCIR